MRKGWGLRRKGRHNGARDGGREEMMEGGREREGGGVIEVSGGREEMMEGREGGGEGGGGVIGMNDGGSLRREGRHDGGRRGRNE